MSNIMVNSDNAMPVENIMTYACDEGYGPGIPFMDS